jgi:hypothetical protein
MQIGTKIYLELGIKKNLFKKKRESGEISLQSAQKNLRRELQLFCITGSVVLWSDTEI